MVLCTQCHKRMAVIFVTKVENGEKVTKGLCLKCAKEMGVPVDNIVGNMMNQFGISPDQMESAEEELTAMMEQASEGLPSDCDDNADGGAPAIDLPKLFRDAGLFMSKDGGKVPDAPKESENASDSKQKTAKKKFNEKCKKQLFKIELFGWQPLVLQHH